MRRAKLNCPINEFYGQTEANLVVAACDGVMDQCRASMTAVRGHDVAILGPDDNPVTTGQVGEVCVRSLIP
jgi:acetyl-CoA synthetase